MWPPIKPWVSQKPPGGRHVHVITTRCLEQPHVPSEPTGRNDWQLVPHFHQTSPHDPSPSADSASWPFSVIQQREEPNDTSRQGQARGRGLGDAHTGTQSYFVSAKLATLTSNPLPGEKKPSTFLSC